VGFPGETLDTYQETLDLIEDARPDTFRGQLWYADPITPVWKKKDEYGIKGSAFTWSHNTMDAQTACDLVDEMFFNTNNSVWLPQNGFEQWSIFYLQRKGMAYERIIEFLKCFNGLVREQLMNPGEAATPVQLLDQIKALSQFHKMA